jgi:hypothetical protein
MGRREAAMIFKLAIFFILFSVCFQDLAGCTHLRRQRRTQGFFY